MKDLRHRSSNTAIVDVGEIHMSVLRTFYIKNRHRIANNGNALRQPTTQTATIFMAIIARLLLTRSA